MLIIGLFIGLALGAAAAGAAWWWWRTVGRLPTQSVVTISLRPETGQVEGDAVQGMLTSRWGRWLRIEAAMWLRPGHDPAPADGRVWVPRHRVLCIQRDPEMQDVRS